MCSGGHPVFALCANHDRAPPFLTLGGRGFSHESQSYNASRLSSNAKLDYISLHHSISTSATQMVMVTALKLVHRRGARQRRGQSSSTIPIVNNSSPLHYHRCAFAPL